MSSNNRGSRWGSSNRQHSRSSTNTGGTTSSSSTRGEVGDDEALRALLSSAEAREQERAGDSRIGNSGNNRHDNKRSRFDSQSNSGSYSNKRQRESGNGDGSRKSDDGSERRGRDRQHGQDSQRSDRHPQKQRRRGGDRERNDYYGPDTVEDDEARPDQKSRQDGTATSEATDAPVEVAKPNFGLSGALTKDEGGGGNVYKGVVLKFREPPEARAPNTQWRLYVFKGKELLQTLHIAKQSAYLIGRNQEIADIPVQHPSLSGQHAVLQYRALPTKQDPLKVACQPYIMDFSTNGTFLNTVRIDSARYYQLKKGDVLTFGASTREYVLMTENTTSVR